MDAAGHPGEAVARHVSSDGVLVWRVDRFTGSDGSVVCVAGFEGLGWHIHPEYLSQRGTPLDRLLLVTEDLLADRLLVLEEIWPSTGPEDPGKSLRLLGDLEEEVTFKANDETWRLRFWSGRSGAVEDLIDGKVAYLPFEEKPFAD